MIDYREDYHEWISAPPRGGSTELDFGEWWTLMPGGPPVTAIVFRRGVGLLPTVRPGVRWQVRWVANTGELYAKERSPDSERFIILGHYPTREAVEARMEGWAEGGMKALAEFFPEVFQ